MRRVRVTIVAVEKYIPSVCVCVCVCVCVFVALGRGQLKCDGTRAETRFRHSAKRTCPFKSAGASVQSTNGSRGVRISGSNAGFTMLRGSVKSTGYPLHSPVSPSLPLPCVTVCHHISTGVCLASNAHTPLRLCCIFPHFLTTARFSEEKKLLNTKCVF